MSQSHHSKVLIIGSGAAGYTAAIYAARANAEPIVVQGLQPGGQMTITADVENYPGFADVIQGPWLMEQMEKQARGVGVRVLTDTIVKADLGRRPFRCDGDGGDVYTGDTLIICTGAVARWLGLPGEDRYKGFGVSACATCDGFFFRGKEVAVVGGGNTAAEEALFLTKFATKVTLVHRRDRLRADKVLQDRLFREPKIEIAWDSVVDEIVGTEDPPGVTGARLRNLKSGETRTLAVDGVFVAIGHDPASELFKGQLEIDPGGYIVTDADSTATGVPGVFAAGDVRDSVFRQAVTAAGMGCMAALEAERFLTEHAAAEAEAAE